MSTAHSSDRRIPFTCPYCGHHTDVEARFAGRTGPCVGCNNMITVPTLQSQVATPATKRSPAASSAQPKWVKYGMAFGGLLSLGVLGVVAYSILQPAIQAAHEASKCSECDSNLRTIGEALEAYYEDRGHYPPAIVYDEETGKPMHSWRVLILPYLGPEAQRVHDMYDMNEPWDGPKNSMLTREVPRVFQCPSDAKSIQGETSYLAVVSDDTVINRDDPTRKSGVHENILTDNPSETMVVLEASGSGVNWLEPKDIPVATLRAGLDSSNPASAGSEHPQGVNILMADGSIIRLEPEAVSTDDLRAMSTINGENEYIEVLDELDY